MKNKKNLIIAGAVILVIVIGLVIYFAFANKSSEDTKDVVTKSSAETIDEETENSSAVDVPEIGETIDIPSDSDELSDDEKIDDEKSDNKKNDDKKDDDKKNDDKKDDDKKNDDKKNDDKKNDDKKTDDKKSDEKTKEPEQIKLPEPEDIPPAQSVDEKKVVDVPTQKVDDKYTDADIYTNKDGQLAAKTDSGKEVEFTGDYMQKLFDEYEKVKGKNPKREKEILDELQLIMNNHEVMELEEEE